MEQHVQVPTHQVIDVSPNDLLVYATLRRYDGEKTYPSIRKIKELSGLSTGTIKTSLKTLEQTGYITIEKRTKTSSLYHFSEYKKFEMYSYAFLDLDIPSKYKAFYIVLQPFIKTDKDSQKAYCMYADWQLAEKLNLDYRTVKSAMAYFEQNGYIITSEDKKKRRNAETGLILQEREINAVLFKQQNILFKKIEKLEEDMKDKITKSEAEAIAKKAAQEEFKRMYRQYLGNIEDVDIIDPNLTLQN